MMSRTTKPTFWLLAEELSSYVMPIFRYKHILEDDDLVIKATIAVFEDHVGCSALDHKISYIDLTDPRSIDKVIKWMISIGLTQPGTTYKG